MLPDLIRLRPDLIRPEVATEVIAVAAAMAAAVAAAFTGAAALPRLQRLVLFSAFCLLSC
jgi:hypothetical protein